MVKFTISVLAFMFISLQLAAAQGVGVHAVHDSAVSGTVEFDSANGFPVFIEREPDLLVKSLAKVAVGYRNDKIYDPQKKKLVDFRVRVLHIVLDAKHTEEFRKLISKGTPRKIALSVNGQFFCVAALPLPIEDGHLVLDSDVSEEVVGSLKKLIPVH